MKVSIEIITKNRENKLYRCLESLTIQTVKPFEVIIIEPSSYFLFTIWKNKFAWFSLNFTYPNSSITNNFEINYFLLI